MVSTSFSGFYYYSPTYAYGYKSENAARLEAALFRHTSESNSRIQKKKWIPFNQRTDDETTELLRKLTQIPKYVLVQCINSAGLLSVAEVKSFRKNARSNRLEHEFDTELDQTPQLREVFKNLFNSQYYTERETRCMKRSLALELQISYTCSDPSESPIVLIPFDVKVCDTSEDIYALDKNIFRYLSQFP